MVQLISKPGITRATASRGVPIQWSQSWFESFITNYLQGSDVRNANAGAGITIAGNIASPYATISAGGPGNPVFTGDVTISPTSGVPLTINIPGAEAYALQAFASAGNAAQISLAGNGVTAANGLILQYSSSGQAQFVLANSIIQRLSAGPSAIAGLGPTASALVDMTPDRGTFTLTGTGFSSTVTSTATWYRIGNIVALNIGTLQGTSNATTFTATGLPAAITPNVTQSQPCFDMLDNSAGTVATAQFNSGSATITFQKSFGVTTAWTNGGTKGVNNTNGTTLFYQLN